MYDTVPCRHLCHWTGPVAKHDHSGAQSDFGLRKPPTHLLVELEPIFGLVRVHHVSH